MPPLWFLDSARHAHRARAAVVKAARAAQVEPLAVHPGGDSASSGASGGAGADGGTANGGMTGVAGSDSGTTDTGAPTTSG